MATRNRPSSLSQQLPFPEPVAASLTAAQIQNLRKPYRGLFVAYSRSEVVDTQAQAHAIVAEVEQRAAAGAYAVEYNQEIFDGGSAAPMDSPITVMRRILFSLRSLSRIA